MKSREDLLRELFLFENPDMLEGITDDLSEYEWDVEKEVASLTREYVISILNRYLLGELSEYHVDEWANSLEMREDIYFGLDKDEDAVVDAIHDLANPVLQGELTPERARNLIKKLSAT